MKYNNIAFLIALFLINISSCTNSTFHEKQCSCRSQLKKKKKSQKQDFKTIFDIHAIFDFDQEITESAENTEKLERIFEYNISLVNKKIDLEKYKLMLLLEEHKKNHNKSSQILSIYRELYRLYQEHYTIVNEYTKEISRIFNNTYEKYTHKVEQNISTASKDSSLLIDEIMSRYDSYLQYNK